MILGRNCIGVGCWGLVFNNKKEVLLVKKISKDYWERPGGKIDFGENSEKTLIRELREETGVKIKILYLQDIKEEINKKDKKHWIAFSYIAKYISGNEKRKEPKIHKEVAWFSLYNLPKKISKQTKIAIKKYLAKA